jgi:SAM-dependent methyltransferase
MKSKYDQIKLTKNEKCKICGSTKQAKIGIRGNREYFSADSDASPHLVTNVVECKNCRFTFCNPRFDGAEKIENDHYAGIDTYFFNGKNDFSTSLTKRVKLLQKHTSGKRGVDVGSGRGEFLNCLVKESYDVIGVEPSAGLAKFSATEYSATVKNDFFENLEYENEFDFITSIHSLEHMEDPHKFIQTCHTALKKDGLIFIEVPNSGAAILTITNLGLRLIGKKWNTKLAPLHPPFHHISYNNSSLSKLLQKNRFEVVTTRTFTATDRGEANYHGFKKIIGIIKFNLTKFIDLIFERECLVVIARKRHTT